MTLTTPPTIENAYPENVLAGGGAAVKWIHGLTREQLHSIVQDKNLPSPLLGELARNVPVKYLKNLVNHKKLEPEFRVSIFRRIFRANTNEMKNEEKLATYNSILNIKNISDKEKRIVNSYIQEIMKLLKKPTIKQSAQALKAKNKEKKSPKARKVVHLPPQPPPDSTIVDVVKFLRLKRSSLTWKHSKFHEKSAEFNIKSALLAHEYRLNDPNFPSIFKHLIPPTDLLLYRMEIDSGIYRQEFESGSTKLFEEFHKDLRGEFSKKFAEEFLHIVDWHELLFTLMLKAVSPNSEDFSSNLSIFKDISIKYEELSARMLPTLNYGKVNLINKGKVEVTFSSSVNLRFDEISFKYWLAEENESFGFPVPIKYSFDFSSRLNACTVVITDLEPGQRYFYEITAHFGDQPFKLEPREFKIPDLPKAPEPTNYVYRDYRDYGTPIPIGGGGERRFQQF